MLNHKISRRTFLKATAATTGALAAVGAEGISFDRWQKAMAAAPETVVPTICEMCGVKCGILAHVKDGRVVKIEGNPKHPFSSGRLCARGNAGMKTLYDPDRLRQPLKRVGENQFVPISWDEAVKEIAGKLKELKAKYGPETLVWACHPELIAPWEKRFTEVFGSPNHTGHAPTCFSSRSVAYNATYGNLPGVDYGNVKYYISPGRNLIEGINNAVVQKIVAAHQNGAKLVALDPRLSNFAAWADEWVPLRPGTDGAFLLGLMHVVIKENLYDESFVREKTVGFEELKAEMEKYTPEWAEKITGIKAATIVRIAKEMAALRPAVAIDPAWHGGLGGMYHNGVQAGRAAACLNALMGNLGAKGGLTFGPGIKLAKEDKLPGPSLPKVNAKRWDGAGGEKWPLAKGLGLIQILPEVVESQKPYPVKALIVSHMNPVRSCPDTGRFLAALKKLELVVAIDIQMSDTAYHAHYILPES
ncbi:MAG: molybdopterin-dependent oxidoreductase, partial [Firmicutes bacterium]|nr:molybdopterin-dependent oxidoreductase [Bacillota bacterium]